MLRSRLALPVRAQPNRSTKEQPKRGGVVTTSKPSTFIGGLFPPRPKQRDESKTTDSHEDDDQQQQQQKPPTGFGVFRGDLYNKPFDGVTWGPGTVALGMTGWAVSFVVVGLVLLPLAVKYSGLGPLSSLSASQKAVYTFVNQGIETIVGISLINAVVAGGRAKAREADEEAPAARKVSGKAASTSKRALPLNGKHAQPRVAEEAEEASELFKISFSDPFAKPHGWAVWAGLGVLVAPLTVVSVASALNAVGYAPAGGKGTVDAVAGIIEMDDVTYLSLFGTTAVLAPLLEEYVFRGFLLTSLTKFMPTWAAVVASAGAFGLAHFSLRDLPQLATLGVVLGFTYVRSRNLLAPMIIHGAWNGTVLTALFLLAASGVDLKEFIDNMR